MASSTGSGALGAGSLSAYRVCDRVSGWFRVGFASKISLLRLSFRCGKSSGFLSSRGSLLVGKIL